MRMWCLVSLFFLLGALPAASGGAEGVIELPFFVASRMGGEWSVEVQAPHRSSITRGTLTVSREVMTVECTTDTSPCFQLRAAQEEEATVLQASGLNAFLARTAVLEPLAYTLCGDGQTNIMNTPHRPELRKKMETTELTDYSGVLDKSEGALRTCQTSEPNVFIRLIGSSVYGLQKDHWRVKQSLHYVEMQFDVKGMTEICGEVGEESGAQRERTTNDLKGKRGRKRRMAAAAGLHGEEKATADQLVRDGFIVIRLVRRPKGVNLG